MRPAEGTRRLKPGGEAAVRELPSGLVTFCFVDVAGSTRAFRSNPEGYPAALTAHHELVRAAFAQSGGVIVETEGDGLFAAFADASAALAGCLRAQLSIAAREWPAGLALRSRMGLHCDQAVPAGDGYVALGVHQAARVSAAAHAGQVLCSAAIAAQAGDQLPAAAQLALLGSFRLKDFDAPAPLFEMRHPGLASPFPAPRAPRVAAGNLRLARTSFVGREAELEQLADLLAEHRLVTILGPGGVGKTRLAYRVAAELTDSFAQGAWVVELAAVSGSGLVADAVARALPLPAAGAGTAEAVLAFLAGRELLLVLDNCEHVQDGAAELTDWLLDEAPGIRVLATSRMPLAVAGEARFGLQPLGLPPDQADISDLLDSEAVRLFVERARTARPQFAVDAHNAAAVTEICRRLDGLPLALELAGARTATLTPADLLSRLDRQLGVLASDVRGLPERHRTLQATLAWSYDLLADPEQVLLARLAVFAGVFDLDWAAVTCGRAPLSPGEISDLLEGLTAKSLAVAIDHDGRTQYKLLLTVREYAAQRLAERGEADEMECSRADMLTRRLASSDPIFRFTANTDQYLAAVASAADDIRAALAWCVASGEGGRARALIANVLRWWNVTGRIAELCPLARGALALPAPPSLAGVMTFYALLLGLEAAGDGYGTEARQAIADMLALARTLGDDNALALALYCQADLPWSDGDYPAAARLFRQAAATARHAGSHTLAAVITRSAAEAGAAGDSARLAAALDPVTAEFRQAGDPFGLAQTLAVQAGAELGCGAAPAAADHAAEGLRIARQHGYAEVGWRHLTLLARAAAALGQPGLAACLLGAVEAALDRAGGKVGAGQGGPADRELARAAAGEALSPGEAAARYAAGRTLTDAEAAELALSVPAGGEPAGGGALAGPASGARPTSQTPGTTLERPGQQGRR